MFILSKKSRWPSHVKFCVWNISWFWEALNEPKSTFTIAIFQWRCSACSWREYYKQMIFYAHIKTLFFPYLLHISCSLPNDTELVYIRLKDRISRKQWNDRKVHLPFWHYLKQMDDILSCQQEQDVGITHQLLNWNKKP